VEVVELGRKYSRLRLSSGKYRFPSTVSVVSLSAMTMPFQVALAMTLPDRIFVPALPSPVKEPGKATD
jgi:hypothetical protein